MQTPSRTAFPLSPMQQGMIFHSLHSELTGTYIVQTSCHLAEELNITAFERAWSHIVARHPMLRTSFGWTEAGELIHLANEEVTVSVHEEDYSRYAPEEQKSRIEDYLERDREKGFDLKTAPIMRLAVFRLSEASYHFIWSTHHALVDGASVVILLKEVFRCYNALLESRSIEFPPAKPFQDYLEWQQKQDMSAAAEYWRGILQGFEMPPGLTSLLSRPQRSSGPRKWNEERVVLEESLSLQVQSVSRLYGASTNAVLQAVWAVLLHRYGQKDVIFGAVRACRSSFRGAESIIGTLVNTVPVRVKMSSEIDVAALVQDVYKQHNSARSYEYASLSQIQLWSGTPARQALFDTLFVYNRQDLNLAFQQEDHWYHRNCRFLTPAHYPVTFVGQQEPSLSLNLSYYENFLDRTTIHRMLGHLQQLLRGIAENPDGSIKEMGLLTEAERQELIAEWNRRDAVYETEEPLQEILWQQAERRRDAVAVSYEGEQLSYGELRRRSLRLGNYLKQAGVKEEEPVGICVQRSLEMVWGIAGILASGGAYVPLDPEYPQERLEYVLKDAGVRVLLTQKKVRERLPATGALVLELDGGWENELQEATEVEEREHGERRRKAEELAYLMYTSGSTGQPKGVMVTHGNVVRLLRATEEWFGFGVEDRWTMFHSYAFDFSVWEMWGALLCGGRLEVVPYWVSRTPEQFVELLRREAVTVLNQTPSAFRQMVEAEQARRGTGRQGEGGLYVRVVIFGGEALELKSLEPWWEMYGEEQADMVNMYGITETTVHVTYRRLRKEDLERDIGSLVGRRIKDLELYVLDEEMEAAPEGVAGEIYVGGEGLARGYWNKGALTAERFVASPWGKAGKRLYRTGDRGRWRGKEELEYLGRNDEQVKVRGFRIELGEIEEALRKHKEVRMCAVLMREDQPGEKRLVGYVVPIEGKEITSKELQGWLKSKLPGYMAPNAFVFLPKLPLTPNGKLDRKALPPPDSAQDENEQTYRSPLTAVEQKLCSIWADVMGVADIGRDDNFYALGGDSILGIQIIARARKAGLQLSSQQLFHHQTISSIAAEVPVQMHPSVAASPAAPLSLISGKDLAMLPQDVEDAYPIGALQEAMLFQSAQTPESSVYHDVFSHSIPIAFDERLFLKAVKGLVRRHPILRTSFHLSEYSELLQLVHRDADPRIETSDIMHFCTLEQREALDAWMHAEKLRPFDPRRPGLLRFQIHQLSPNGFQLTISFHHAILDGWSLASLLMELLSSYLAMLQGRTYRPTTPLSYFRDFIHLERQTLRSAEPRSFWQRVLDGAVAPRIPTWNAAREVEIKSVTADIPDELSESLKALASRLGTSIKNVLLAAHFRVLNLISGQNDLTTGVVANGRIEEEDGERVLGLFLNTLPFRLQLAGGRWIDLIRTVSEAEAAFWPHRRFPLAEIKRLMNGAELFNVVFNFVHFHVYRELQELLDWQASGNSHFEQTEFDFATQFGFDAAMGRLKLILVYNSFVVDHGGVEAIKNYYLNALRKIADEPEEPYQRALLLTSAECRQLLQDWNNTGAAYPAETCVQQEFERQVERTPAAIALFFEGQHLSYAELNERANAVAHSLKQLRVEPDHVVAVLMERSLEMVIGLLGIIKAGACYLPLDPEYPENRLDYMVKDADARMLLTDARSGHRLAAFSGTTLQVSEHLMQREGINNPACGVAPHNLAYVIYTSGSTGRPKGIGITHNGLMNLICWRQRMQGIIASDRSGQTAALSFDASILEIWPCLLSGSCLCLPTREILDIPSTMCDWFIINQITVCFMQTPLARLLLDMGLLKQLRLRSLQVGGDRLPAADWNALPYPVFNLYGPTEITVVSAWACVDSSELPAIGRPVANTRLYVLDVELSLLPAGVSGELYIGGAGLARGYLKQGGLTAEKFIPDLYGAVPGARLYRTGDLVRWRPDGRLDWIGRLDQQTKIRGYRIELGEIEAALSLHRTVRECAVLALEAEGKQKQLVGYWVKKNESTGVSPDELRRHLHALLPAYMVPAAFVELEEFPRMPSGKIDRVLLMRRDEMKPAIPSREYIGPGTQHEKTLAKIWCNLLGLKQVGIKDDFIQLGGDSLLLMRMLSKIKDIYKIGLPRQNMLVDLTIEKMASAIDQELATAGAASAAPIARRARQI